MREGNQPIPDPGFPHGAYPAFSLDWLAMAYPLPCSIAIGCTLA